jgi:hypothetical protein
LLDGADNDDHSTTKAGWLSPRWGRSRKAQREQMFRRRGSYILNSVISDGGEATMEELNGFRFFILARESVDTLWID